MDFILNRYRNVTVLMLVIAAQLLLLAYQVRTNDELQGARAWSITAITPMAQMIEGVRAGTVGFLRDYFILLHAREENRQLKEELTRTKLENQFLRTELSTADRARALAAFASRTPSRTIAGRIIANATGANSKVVFADRGIDAGVQPGMAVVTPDGIVGKVISVYRNASQVMLITDRSFAAGVVSEKYRVHGTLKGQGHGTLIVDYVPSELKVEVGEKFYTSGDDRIFPKGMPVGEVRLVRPGRAYKEIFVAPSGFQQGLEEVLIVLEGVHQPIPPASDEKVPYHLLPLPPDVPKAAQSGGKELITDADRVRERHRSGNLARPPQANPPAAPPAAQPPADPNSVAATTGGAASPVVPPPQ